MEPVLRILRLAANSAYLSDEEVGISVLLVAEPESGKTQAIKTLVDHPLCHLENDFTKYGMVNLVKRNVLRDGKRCILIPDLLLVMSQQAPVVQATIAILSALVEDGLRSMHSKFIQLELPVPAYASVITSITTGELRLYAPGWIQKGFLQRFLVVSYSHSPETQTKIFDLINNGSLLGTSPAQGPKLNPGLVRVPPTFSPAIRTMAATYSKAMHYGHKAYGYRAANHIRKLLKTVALERGSKVVEVQDLSEVTDLLVFANLQETAI